MIRQGQERWVTAGTRRIAALLAVAACGIAGLVVPGSGAATSRRRTAQTGAGVLTARFGILAAARKTASGIRSVNLSSPNIGPALKALVSGGGASMFGLNLDSAKQAWQTGGVSVWLLPGSNGLCAILADAAGPNGQEFGVECKHTGQVLSRGEVAFTDFQGTYFAWGAVPNGTAKAVISLSGSRTVVVAVRDDAFAASFASAPTKIAFSSDSGAASLPVVRAGRA